VGPGVGGGESSLNASEPRRQLSRHGHTELSTAAKRSPALAHYHISMRMLGLNEQIGEAHVHFSRPFNGDLVGKVAVDDVLRHFMSFPCPCSEVDCPRFSHGNLRPELALQFIGFDLLLHKRCADEPRGSRAGLAPLQFGPTHQTFGPLGPLGALLEAVAARRYNCGSSGAHPSRPKGP
jgi:hypothetical protein